MMEHIKGELNTRYKEFEEFMHAKHNYGPDGNAWNDGVTSFIGDNFGTASMVFNPKYKDDSKFEEGRVDAQREFLLFQLLTPSELNILIAAYNINEEM